MDEVFKAVDRLRQAYIMGSASVLDRLRDLAEAVERARVALGEKPLASPGVQDEDAVAELLTLLAMLYDGHITPGSKLWQERVEILLKRLGKKPS